MTDHKSTSESGVQRLYDTSFRRQLIFTESDIVWGDGKPAGRRQGKEENQRTLIPRKK
ncbi:MAG: hypothetical protein ABUK01_17530 [Leptospirales bacterium]